MLAFFKFFLMNIIVLFSYYISNTLTLSKHVIKDKLSFTFNHFQFLFIILIIEHTLNQESPKSKLGQDAKVDVY